jgi:putative phosphoesterase
VIGVLSDAHGNRPGFDAAIAALRNQGARRFVFLGDAVGYLPTRDVLAAILELGDAITCLRGNHEDMVLAGRLDPAREPMYQHDAVRRQLRSGDVELMASWPTRRSLVVSAGTALYVHGSPADPAGGYVYPDTDLASFEVDADFVFMGHTHRPFVRQCGHTQFVNVGSCGLPRDCPGSGSAALFDEATGSIRLVRFDIGGDASNVLAATPDVHPSIIALLKPVPAP